MTKFLSDLIVKGVITADNGIVLGAGKNISTTNQVYIGATNYANSIVVGWDTSAVYLGYSMGSLPIHLGSNGSGNIVLRTTGNTVVENGALVIGQAVPESGTKLTINGNVHIKNGYLYGQAANGGDYGFYPDGGYYEFSSPTGANQGPILILNCRFTGKQVGFYAGDTTYPGMLLYEQAPVGGDLAYWTKDKWAMTPNHNLVWAATSGGIAIAQGPYDIGLTREAAGVLQVNNGTVGTYANLKLAGLTASSLIGTGSRMVVADATGTLSTTAIPSSTDTLYTVTQRGNTTFGDIVVNGKGSFTDHVTINTDPALFSGTAYNGYKVLGIGSTTGGGLSFVSSNGVAAEVFGDNTATGLYLASYGVVPVITFWLNTTEVAKYKTNGDLLIANLAGTGTRMVVADSTGTLSVQAMPSGDYLPLSGGTLTGELVGTSGVFDYLTASGGGGISATGGAVSGMNLIAAGSGTDGGALYIKNGTTAPGTFGGHTGIYHEADNSLTFRDYPANRTFVFSYPSLSAKRFYTLPNASGTLALTTDIVTTTFQGALDADKTTAGSLAVGTTIVKSVSATTYSGVFFDYVVKNGTNVRVGSVVAISNGTNVEFYETLSNDIGTTTGLTFTVTLGSGNINLNAVAASTGFTVIVSTRAI